jgi:hypothetical protein
MKSTLLTAAVDTVASIEPVAVTALCSTVPVVTPLGVEDPKVVAPQSETPACFVRVAEGSIPLTVSQTPPPVTLKLSTTETPTLIGLELSHQCAMSDIYTRLHQDADKTLLLNLTLAMENLPVEKMGVAEECLRYLANKANHSLQDVLVCQYAMNGCVLLKQCSPDDGSLYNADVSSVL